MIKRVLRFHLVFLSAWISEAQTTQGIITGRVFNRDSGVGISTARITYTNLKTKETGFALSNNRGVYSIPFLPPGPYQIKAEKEGYKSQVLPSLDLQVAERIDLNFPLRSRTGGIYGGVPLAGQKEVVNFFGPDVGFATPLEVLEPHTLDPSLSYVMESAEITAVPLRGRDPYSLLLAVPSATSDTATSRSLGLSINGQRPYSSNFLLDGLENNDDLITGIRIQVAPELVETYRISTNNVSAESGKAAGFVANAATKSGSNSFHGLIYNYVGNDILNANSFQGNLLGIGRRPDRSVRPGFWAGGPVRKDHLWFSTGLELYRMRGNGDPQNYSLPGARAFQFAAPDSAAATLLHRFPSPALGSDVLVANLTLAPQIAVDQLLLLERLDYRSTTGQSRLMGRFARSRQSQPDLYFSPYPGLSSGLRVAGTGLALEYLTTLRPALMNDLRAGWNSSEQRLDRAHPEVPTLQTNDGVQLPGSPLLRASVDRGSTWELSDSVVWMRGRHMVTMGGGYQRNRLSSTNSFGQTAYFTFENFTTFLRDAPFEVGIAVNRDALPQLMLPDLGRSYENNQFFGFVQDSLKLSSRVSLSLGLRYDSFGTFVTTGVQNAGLTLGPGSSIQERLAGAQIAYGGSSPYRPDRNDWSGRSGVAYDLKGDGAMLLRAGFGIYYDRPFGLLFQNVQFNNVDYRAALYLGSEPTALNFLQPVRSVLSGLTNSAGPGGPPLLTSSINFSGFYWIDARLRTPHVQTWFADIEHYVRKGLRLEVSQTGALGRKLMATDVVNRPLSVPREFRANPNGYLNPGLPQDIFYRSNSGSSNYMALSAALKYRGARLVAQFAYTYSHSIDNQSDALQEQDSGLTLQSSSNFGISAFTRQFDSRIDRASSDFDQRQNFAFYTVYRLPNPWKNRLAQRLLDGWELSELGAFRSGFPFSVLAPSGFNALVNNRADLVVDGRTQVVIKTPAEGGKQYLNPAAFRDPFLRSSDALGTLGRNSIIGPGFFSVDASLAKTFPLRWLGESGRISIRSDWFNLLNHTNLGYPVPFLTSTNFGLAQFGGTPRPSSSLLVAPLDQTVRQVRFQLKVEF